MISEEAARWQSTWELSPREVAKREKKLRKKRHKLDIFNLAGSHGSHSQSTEDKGSMTERLVEASTSTFSASLVNGAAEPVITQRDYAGHLEVRPVVRRKAKSEMFLDRQGAQYFIVRVSHVKCS